MKTMGEGKIKNLLTTPEAGKPEGRFTFHTVS